MVTYDNKLCNTLGESMEAVKAYYKMIQEKYVEFINLYNFNITQILADDKIRKIFRIGMVCADLVCDMSYLFGVMKTTRRVSKAISKELYKMPDFLSDILEDVEKMDEEIFINYSFPRFSSLHNAARSILEIYAKFYHLYISINNQTNFDIALKYYYSVDFYQAIRTFENYINDITIINHDANAILTRRQNLNDIYNIITNNNLNMTLSDNDFITHIKQKYNEIKQEAWFINVPNHFKKTNEHIGNALSNNNFWKNESGYDYEGAYTIYSSICAETHNNMTQVTIKTMFLNNIEFNAPIYQDTVGIQNLHALLSVTYACLGDVLEKCQTLV